MNEYIDSLKLKLIQAVDLNQKKINKISDIYDALKQLESFPMTLDILNSSRIGKIVNEIRHFNDAQSDIKTRLKDLIKQWNDQLLPHRSKKPNKSSSKPSNSNGCNNTKSQKNSSDNTNKNNHYNNENYKSKHHSQSMISTHKNSNNLELTNGMKKPNSKTDCDNNNSFDIPAKKPRFDNKTLNVSTNSPKNLLKEIHQESDSCPPFLKSHNSSLSQHSNNSPARSHFSDIKRFIKREDDPVPSSLSPSLNVNRDSSSKHRKRKHEAVVSLNGVPATPLQKVKSTRELLAEMGDLVGSDTKKKILCNEIALEDDIPKSCIPESVRPKPKPIKQSRNNPLCPDSASSNKSFSSIKCSPKSLQTNDYYSDFYSSSVTNNQSQSIESSNDRIDHQTMIKTERTFSSSSLSFNQNIKESNNKSTIHNINNNHNKNSPFNGGNSNESPLKLQLKRSPNVTTSNIYNNNSIFDGNNQSAQSVTATPPIFMPTPSVTQSSDDLEKCSLKIKIPLKSHKKKSKHHDPPITNRMNDLPLLPDLAVELQKHSQEYYYQKKETFRDDEDFAEKLARCDLVGYNCTRHPISGETIGFCEHYVVGPLHVLAWTDKVNECQSFFPVDTELELGWLESLIRECS